MNSIKRNIPTALCIFACAIASAASWAQDAAPACQPITNVQKRIVEKANLDMESLRSFVWMTNFVYGIDMAEVRGSLDSWRAAVACHKQQVARAAEEAEALKISQSGR